MRRWTLPGRCRRAAGAATTERRCRQAAGAATNESRCCVRCGCAWLGLDWHSASMSSGEETDATSLCYRGGGGLSEGSSG